MLDYLVRIDTALFLILNRRIANPVFDAIFPFLTTARNWVIPILLIGLIFVWRRKKGALIILGLIALTVLISDPLSVRLIKPLVGRLRPNNPELLVEGGRFLMGYSRSLSFPSSHATNMFAQAALLSGFFPKRAWIFYTIASLVGFSRVYVGVHYPFDVLGGAIIGTLIGWSIHRLYIETAGKRRKAL